MAGDEFTAEELEKILDTNAQKKDVRLPDFGGKYPKEINPPNFIKQKVAEYFQIDDKALASKERTKELAYARQIAMYFSKQLTKSSLATIGAHCGGKDHATVLHACRTVNNLIDTDKRFRVYISDIEKKINLS